ncbi:MAG: efflux transporter periplasmic adaptor subunit, partial [Planctomycetota bacterium]
NTVWVVDAEQQLRRRAVAVLRAERERVLLGSGLAAGERVCLSDLELAADGLSVRVAAEPAPADGR